MVKLTADLIENTRQYINPVRDRELDLRSYKIPTIENLGATYDQFDTVDFTDNDLKKLENFPFLNRLKSLILCNNRINYIDPKIGENLPNIHTVVLTNNDIKELGDIDSLATLPKLEYLSLIGNPVEKKNQYRPYVIHKLPQLRVLDFRRIKLTERQAAEKLFKGKKGAALKQEIVKKSKSFNVGSLPNDEKSTKINGQRRTPEELKAIQNAILNAKSLDEVNRLQELLQSGASLTDLIAAVNKNGAAPSRPINYAGANLDVELEEEDD